MEMHHLTLLDRFRIAGWAGFPIVAITSLLIVAGVVFITRRPSTSVRWGYMVAALLPPVIGLAGSATSMMKAFGALGTSGLANHLLAAVAEVSHALVMGMFGGSMAMTLAAFVWMTGHEQPPPAIPAETQP